MLAYKGYNGSSEIDTEEEVCYGKILCINDLITYQADSPKDLKKAFEEAVDDYLATCRELGREPQKPFRGLFNVRIDPALHRTIALRAADEHTSLNSIVEASIRCYLQGSNETHNHFNITVRSDEPIYQTLVSYSEEANHVHH